MWRLFADPRLENDKQLIELFKKGQLTGTFIPTSASAGLPELTDGNQTITGRNAILDFLKSLNTQ